MSAAGDGGSRPPRPVRWALLVPFAYLWRTRLERDPSVFGLVVMADWVPALLILVVLLGLPVPTALALFAGGYLSFISLYELGYLANDLLASGRPHERSRLGRFPPGPAWVTAAVLARVGYFAAGTIVLGPGAGPVWWGFYLALVAGFTAHNVLEPLSARVVTFAFLATARFLAPIFWLLPAETFGVLIPAVLVGYVLQRTLGYLESKGALHIEGRAGSGFKVRFYATAFLPMALFSLLLGSWVPLAFNAYYMALWSAGALAGVGRDRASATPA